MQSQCKHRSLSVVALGREARPGPADGAPEPAVASGGARRQWSGPSERSRAAAALGLEHRGELRFAPPLERLPQAPFPTREEREAFAEDWDHVPDERFKEWFLDWELRGEKSIHNYPPADATCELVDWQELLHYIDDGGSPGTSDASVTVVGAPAAECATFESPFDLVAVESGNWVVKDRDT